MADPTPRKTDVRQRTTLGNRFRFLVRGLGVLAVLAVAAGAVATAAADLPDPGTWVARWDLGVATVTGGADPFAQVAVGLLAGGAAVVLVWAVVEVVSGLFLVTGKRSAIGTNAAVQTALAVALLVLVNVISFGTYWRFDTTRTGEFTLPADRIAELRKLRPDAATTIVVLQKHKTAGTLSDTPDSYDYAAERKVVEKVQDLVDQVREFGPRFNVVVLDAADDRNERRVAALTRTRPGLKAAIDAAPDNSILFYADGKVQKRPKAEADKLAAGPGKPAVVADPADPASSLVYASPIGRMSFAEFYQLDKTASREATAAEREGLAAVGGSPAFAPGVAGTGNLVLIPRGKDAFVARVLALEERRPKVALAVGYTVLSTKEGLDGYGAAGLRKALEANGFDVLDILVKKPAGRGAPSPAAYTYDESELDRTESLYNRYSLLTYDRELAVKILAAERVKIGQTPLPDLDRRFRRVLGHAVTTEADRAEVLAIYAAKIEEFKTDGQEYAKKLAEVAPRYQDLLKNERAVEGRRQTDVKAKLKQYVADCDVLIVPRLTTVDLTRGEAYSPAFFTLSREQAAAVKEFVAARKPVLFAFGPPNAGRGGFPGNAGPDDVDALLPRLGIELGTQTIVTEAEALAMAERGNEELASSVVLPPVSFDPRPGDKDPNPIARAFAITDRAVDKKLDVKRSGFRPVYVAPGFADKLKLPNGKTFAGEIMFTTRDAWNEDKPLPDADYIPKFDETKPDNPRKDYHDTERRGPFPVGVAVEVPVPAEWLDTNPEIAPKAVPAAAAVGVAAAYPLAPQFAENEQAAALMLTADGGLSAAMLSVAASKLDRPTVRVVAFGHGGLFTGTELKPGHQTLLLHTLNWLLRRDERLPADVPDDQKWRFPRADLTPRDATLWRLGTITLLPLLCGLLGVVVLMARKVR